jgi:hypothetical protein
MDHTNNSFVGENRENVLVSIRILQVVVVLGLVLWMICLILELSTLIELKPTCRRRITDISPRRIAYSFGQDERKRSHWHLKGLLFANTIANLLFISIVGVLAFRLPMESLESCDYIGRAVFPLYAITSQTSLLFCRCYMEYVLLRID